MSALDCPRNTKRLSSPAILELRYRFCLSLPHVKLRGKAAMDSQTLGIKNSQSDLLLVKDNLAAYFRREIISGRLAPGEKIVEVKYAKLLKLSQTSVREAINILTAEGFVQKGSGRTAQVTQLSDEDINHRFELR